MGALLIFDISSPDSMANPANKLPNPMALMSSNAFHGGAMRCLYMYTTGVCVCVRARKFSVSVAVAS